MQQSSVIEAIPNRRVLAIIEARIVVSLILSNINGKLWGNVTRNASAMTGSGARYAIEFHRIRLHVEAANRSFRKKTMDSRPMDSRPPTQEVHVAASVFTLA